LIVFVNGEERDLAEGTSIVEIITDLGLKPERVAVEVNRRIVRRSEWPSTTPGEGDRVEIVHFVGGGATGDLLNGTNTD
jgi:thiamine biosynthesis protein ThiS